MAVRIILCIALLGVCYSANLPENNPVQLSANANLNNRVGTNQGQGQGSAGGNSKATSQPLKLVDHPDCREDVQKYCRKSSNNFAVLECFQNDLKDEDEISVACQHVLWQYKSNLTQDMRYESAASSICRDDIGGIPECTAEKPGSGFILSCLINNIDVVKNTNCHQFLLRMKSIVFSDYRYIHKFVDKCKADIDKFSCGRIGNDDEKGVEAPHDQGKTLSCLAEKAAELDDGCRQQLLRVAELQADDYHNDRQLYFACRDDRERLCSNVRPGNGDVYRCLYRHKFDTQMSNECRKQLSTRQKLQREDYKVNQGLFAACRQDIIRNQCEIDTTRGSKMVKMATILLCMEKAVRKGDGSSLAPECVAELKEVRRSLLEDYEISPEIAHKCHEEIHESCQKVGPRNVIHCLMDLARPRPNGNNQNVMSEGCKKELKDLIREADIDEDYSVDPMLQDACRLIVNEHCQRVTPGEGRVYGCLMSLVDKPGIMTPECKEKLMEIEYFVSRDFRLSVAFGKRCSKEIERFGCAPNDAESIQDQSMTLLCLYRKQKSNKAFDPMCGQEVKRLMVERANSVDLEPEVEQNCMTDLASMCSEKTGKNEEMNCLEDNLEKLSPECKTAVEAYTKLVDELPELNQIFAEACQEFWKENCKDALNRNKEDEDSADALMECLIKNKNHEDMNAKCRAGIEHHQLITMEDFHLSRAFREACSDDVKEKCAGKKKKAEVVNCLSSYVHEDTLRGQKQRVSAVCRKQLKFELMQRSVDIKLDPELEKACTADIRDYCRGQSEVIECLRSHQASLKPQCHEVVFKREKEEADDPTTDFNLMTKCKKMIKKYCLDVISSSKKGDTLITCLVRHKEDEDNFDEKCSKVLVQRLRIRAHDVRLNPDLMRDCKKDIRDHCRAEMQIVNGSQSEAEGRVLFCLRKQFAIKKLTQTCTNHVTMLIQESILDHVQDIKLAKECGPEIKELCADAVEADKNADVGGSGEVLECLRQKLLIKANDPKVNAKCIAEVVRSLTENQADVHLDPLLFRACALDLKGYCEGIPRGDGRQMSCLLSALNDKSVKLQKDCHKHLSDRVQLWDAAAKMAPPDSMGELLSQVYDSEARTYLVTFITFVVMFIFIGGLCCGRVTKRVAQQIKNK